MSEITLEVRSRELTGKNANRRLRASGRVPAVVYGDSNETVAIDVGERQLQSLLRSEGGENAVFLLKLEGTDKSRPAMLRDVQADPIFGKLIHVDFMRISMSVKVQVTVPIEIHGVAEGVKTQGGVLDFVSREIEVECLPADIPPHIELDVTALEIGDHVEASQLDLPDKVELLDEPGKVIVSISAPRLEEEEDEDDEDTLLEAAAAEPERIGEDGDEDEDAD